MSRKHEPLKTKYQNIFEIIASNSKKEYLARWTQQGRQYYFKNLTKKFGSTTAKQASTKLEEIKILIAKGEDPFEKNDDTDRLKKIRDIVLDEIRTRRASDDYRYNQEVSFLKHLDPLIGNMRLEDLTIKVIVDVFSKLQKTQGNATIENLKKALRPTLDYAADEGLIDKNPFDAIRVKKVTKTSRRNNKAPLKHRLLGSDNNRFLDTARAIYNGALHFEKNLERVYETEIPDREFQLVFLIVTMTGRRRGEVLAIRYEDITSYGTVKTSIETTKESVWEEYPLPQEVIDLLEPEGKGRIVPNITVSSYAKYIRKFIAKLDLPIHNDAKMTGHDSRNLFLTIMSKETKNPFLCDSALSHSDKKYEMLRTYYEPDISDYRELFEHYWDLLRGKRELTK